MANYYSYYSQTPNSFSSLLLLSISLTFFLLLAVKKVNSAEEIVSFEFTKFKNIQDNLILQGDAQVVVSSQDGIDRLELTIPNYHSVGRVLYETPIHIWDSEKDTIASFQTNFTFAIYTPTQDKFAEGLVFFLAPMDTQPQPNSGGLLGIFSGTKSNEPIVAVEFDTFSNPWDPIGQHIGIDINSIKSTKTTPWNLEYDYAHVSISYDASTFSLTVSLFYGSNPDVIYTVKESVDLRDVLPPWVRIGLSGTTGDNRVEQDFIYTWSFYSKLPDSSNIIGFKKTNVL